MIADHRADNTEDGHYCDSSKPLETVAPVHFALHCLVRPRGYAFSNSQVCHLHYLCREMTVMRGAKRHASKVTERKSGLCAPYES